MSTNTHAASSDDAYRLRGARLIGKGRNALLIGVSSFAVLTAGFAMASPQPESRETTYQLLFEQARFWKEKGRGDLAISALGRVLQSDPGNALALYETARVLVDQGDIANARTYERRLFKAAPNNPLSDRLRTELKNADLDRDTLERARAAAGAGNVETAIAEYEKLFRGREVAGSLAVEYYHTLSGMDGRWDEARLHLGDIVAREPDNFEAAIAYIDVLSYREETRRDAIEKYLEMAQTGQGGDVPLDHLRRSLLWMGANRQDEALFDAYLAQRPNDAEILKKWQLALNPAQTDSFGGKKAAAFDLLNQNQLDAAEAALNALLTEKPQDADALAGLGILRLRQKRYADAAGYLSKALDTAPEKTADFGDALHAARFWGGMDDIRAAAGRGDFSTAERLYGQLQPVEKSERINARLIGAQIASAAGQTDSAQKRFKEVLLEDPGNADAFVGLIGQLMQEGDASRIANALNTTDGAKFGSGESAREARAKQLHAEAWLAERRGAVGAAEIAYRNAVAYAKDDGWLLLSAARFMAEHGNKAEADRIIGDLARLQSSEAKHALAIYYAEQDNWPAAVDALKSIPQADWKPEHRALLARAEMRARVRQLVATATPTLRSVTAQELYKLYQEAAPGDGTAHLVGSALIDIGASPMALKVLRQDLGAPGSRPASYFVVSARLLSSAKDYDGTNQVLGLLRTRQNELKPAERMEVARIYDSMVVSVARAAMARGDYDLAREYLQPAQAGDPSNTEILRALGELNQRTGHPADALTLYSRALEIDPNDQWAVEGAVGSALSLRQFRVAGDILDKAIATNPDNPRLYVLVSQAAEAAGDLDTAIQAREMAKTIEKRRSREGMPLSLGGAEGTGGASTPDIPASNPFRLSNRISFRPDESQGRFRIDSGLPQRGAETPRIEKASYTFVGDETPRVVLADWAQPAQQPEDKPIFGPSGALNGDVQYLMSDDLASQLDQELADTQAALEKERAAESAGAIGLRTPSGKIVNAPTAVMVQLVELLIQSGDYEEADDMLAALEGDGLTPGQQAQVASMRGKVDIACTQIALKQGDEAEAVARLKRLGLSHRDDPDVLKLFGQYSDAKGDDAKAALFYEEALKYAPADVDARVGAASNLMDIGETDKAAAIADAGLRDHPDVAALHFIRGRIKKEQGDLQGALADFENAKRAGAGSTVASVSPAADWGTQDTEPQTEMDDTYNWAGLVPSESEPSDWVGSADEEEAGQTEAQDLDFESDEGSDSHTDEFWGQGLTAGIGSAMPDYSEPAYTYLGGDLQTAQAEPEDIRRRLRNLGSSQSPPQAQPSYDRSPAYAAEPAKGPDSLIDWDLAELRNKRGAYVGPTMQFRWREGEEGLSQLTEFKGPFEINFRPMAGRLSLELVPTFISAGTFNDDPFLLRRFGSFSTVPEASRFKPDADAAAGIGFGIGYDVGGFSAGLGTSPIGFEILNILGHVGFDHYFSNGFGFRITAGRKSVTDSVLSYAGAEDPLTGQSFGGVAESYGGVSLSQDFGKAGIYLNGGYSVLTGDQMANNKKMAGDIGFFATLAERDGHAFKTGFNVSYFGFEKNQRFFTIGHGGYFSPQTFFSAAVPVDYSYQNQRLEVKLSSSFGIQYFSEDRTPYFPDRTDLQIALATLEGGALDPQPIFYDAERKTALGLKGGGEFTYKVTPSLHLTGGLSVDRAADWTEAIGNVRVKYWIGGDAE